MKEKVIKSTCKNIKSIEKKSCFGCRSCELICPVHCISMSADTEGFIFPIVIDDLCISCGICLAHCPSVSCIKVEKPIQKKFYALQLKDDKTLALSSSGGASAGFADFVLSEKGKVFGCVYDENFYAKMICVNTKDDFVRMQGSKYVFSDTMNTFLEVLEILKKFDKTVIYIGRPCQIAGLKSFLKVEYKNLITIDLICHGTPSQKLFSKYLQWLEMKNAGKIIYYGFRDKDVNGWCCGGKTKTKTKTKTIDAQCDPYYVSFLRGENYRESCYICPYSSSNRIGDISIGDFWGCKEFYPNVLYDKGISVCSVNSKKGQKFFELAKTKFFYFEISSYEALKENANFIKPTNRPSTRNSFYDGIDDDVKKIIGKIKTRNVFVSIVRNAVKKILPNKILKIIRNYSTSKEENND